MVDFPGATWMRKKKKLCTTSIKSTDIVHLRAHIIISQPANDIVIHILCRIYIV